MPFAHAGVRLRGTFSLPMPHDATRTTILSWGSSLLQGLTRSTCRKSLNLRRLSQGPFPFNAFGGRSLRDFRQPVPSGRLRSVLRLLQPLDGLLLHPPSAPFDAVTLVGFSLQGFPLPNRLSGSSPESYPLGVSPSALRTLLLGKERTGGANADYLVVACLRLYRLQGLAPFESPCRAETPLSTSAGRSPPGLHPP